MSSKDAELKIEPLDLSDEGEMRFLFETRSHPAVAGSLFGPAPASFDAHKRWVAANVPAKRRMYVARAEGRMVGYCHAYGFEGGEVEVGFVVHPDFQRRGYGGGMVDLLVAELDRTMPGKRMVLRVRMDNFVAARTYRRHGFEVVGTEGWVFVCERKRR